LINHREPFLEEGGMSRESQCGYFLGTIFILSLLCNCAPVPTTNTTAIRFVPTDERVHKNIELTGTDFVALASRVTEQMLSSEVVQHWKRRPLIVVAVPQNTTHDANIITEDLQDEIIRKILDAGIARVIDESDIPVHYDYILKTTITDTVQYGAGGSKLTCYTCKLQLFTIIGERVGEWHDRMCLEKGPRTFF